MPLDGLPQVDEGATNYSDSIVLICIFALVLVLTGSAFRRCLTAGTRYQTA